MATFTITFKITLSSLQKFNNTIKNFNVSVNDFFNMYTVNFKINRRIFPEEATTNISVPSDKSNYNFEFSLNNYQGNEIILGGTYNLLLSASGTNINVVTNNIPMDYGLQCNTCFTNIHIMRININNQLSVNNQISANKQNKCVNN